MHDTIKKFLFGTIPAWKFWEPQSGLAGGLIMGMVIVNVAVILHWLLKYRS